MVTETGDAGHGLPGPASDAENTVMNTIIGIDGGQVLGPAGGALLFLAGPVTATDTASTVYITVGHDSAHD